MTLLPVAALRRAARPTCLPARYRIGTRQRLATISPAAVTSTMRQQDAPLDGVLNLDSPFMPGEPPEPIVHSSAFPGPNAKQAIQRLDQIFDVRSLNMMVDYHKSIGNYIADLDGNLLLDVFAQIASIPLGYSNPALKAIASSPDMVSALVNRPALGSFPQHDWADILETGLLEAAPEGLTRVCTGTTGSDANEMAYKAAFMWKRQQQRGSPDIDFTEDEIRSSMENKSPGCPSLSIMSFRGGFHGRLFGSLSTTRSKPIHKLDIPAFDWPQAPFPKLKYPLADHQSENAQEEARCLAEIEELMTTWHSPPAAIIVEPIQAEGGDNHASPAFFRGLRDLTLKHDILLIVDEVQTGVGATGKFWAHQHWGLSQPPDMVTFSKKAQAAGFFYGRDDLRPNKPYRQYNTWYGAPAQALLFRGILNEIKRLDLVRHTAETGAYLYNGLEKLAEQYPDEIMNLRGHERGTFIAWDSPRRDEMLAKAKTVGLNIGGSGAAAIRLRPMLIFQKRHADILLERLQRLMSN